MKNLDYFEKQMKIGSLVTKEIQEDLKCKNYSSGRKIEINDKVLYGFLEDEHSFKLITLHQDELENIYEVTGYFNGETNEVFPNLKLKNKL